MIFSLFPCSLPFHYSQIRVVKVHFSFYLFMLVIILVKPFCDYVILQINLNMTPCDNVRSQFWGLRSEVWKSWWERGRWSIYQCSTQFPIDIECRLHGEPITDRQFGSQPPLAKTGLASALYRLPIIRKGGIYQSPDSSQASPSSLPGYFQSFAGWNLPLEFLF